MRLTFCAALIPAGAIAVLTGCEPNQLYMGSRTVVGINASINPEQSTGSLIVGYDRNFAAVIPRSAEYKRMQDAGVDQQRSAAPGQKRDAMAAIACSEMAVYGVTIRKFTESIATGQAAEAFADALNKDPGKIKDFFVCFKNSDEKSEKSSTATKSTGS
ncbi:MAG: hypothetical protein FD144_2308 [Rhodospirillaceae bacterium]|nr:MAG: hypothetical protein FD144_2308 [Rhodospirillaceae bacterium]